MRFRKILLSVVLLGFSFLSPPGFAEGEPKISHSLKLSPSKGEFDQRGYFTFRPDFRKCVSPLCGGIFVKAVNQKLTRCANGHMQEECYVATITSRGNLDFTSAALLNGHIKRQTFPGFGNLGTFVLEAAYGSATTTAGTGKFVGLENNGIVCITSPCFSMDQYLLNRKKIRAISGFDLEQIGASEDVINQARAIMANGGVLIASGVNKQVEELAGPGITFVADQIYLPLPDSQTQ